jgi:magnesium-transporting ATPase (P-type)
MPTSATPTTTEPSPEQRPARSARSDIGPISNALLYLAFCLLAATGLVMTFRLEDGRETLLGLVKQDFARIHAITALSVLSLVVLHLWVNWRWVRTMLARLRWRTVVVATVGLVLLAVVLLAPVR